jgi:hypothetical protein
MLLAVLGAACAPALAQISDAQRSAIKSACRGDYMKVCASVPTGTQASLQCLQQHSSQVSSGCQSALSTVGPAPAPAAPAAATTPAATTAPAAPTGLAATAAPAASAPAAAPVSQPERGGHALRRDCGSDFEKFCPGAGLGGGRAVGCLKAHASELSASCKAALASMQAAH